MSCAKCSEPAPRRIHRLVVIGVGLIGGSFALDLRRHRQVDEIIGVGRSRANLDVALNRGVIDRIAEDVASVVAEADCILLALPVAAMARVLATIAPALPTHCLVTDVGSTKQDVIAAARTTLGDKIGQFIPAHPIAGAETSGAEAAREHLFDGKALILTPLPENRPEDVTTLTALWQTCGARVTAMAADVHDRVFAAVSHLPHLAAFALVDDLIGRPEAELCFGYAGAGFRDFTRIAASSPEMWRDIALANREALLIELDAYLAKLTEVRALIEHRDGDALHTLFIRASAARRKWQGG